MAQDKRCIVSSKDKRNQPPTWSEVEDLMSGSPRTILIQKKSEGFGFTLRHFIVYPPHSSHYSPKHEVNSNSTGKLSCQRSCLEPMDTIFVKSVKKCSPAQQAGLCSGDRLVKVNGVSVLGKTYSQVIALIQKSENLLQLSIMPKDDDVLQLVSVNSLDANLKGSGIAKGPPTKPGTTPSTTSPGCRLDNRQFEPTKTTSPMDSQSAFFNPNKKSRSSFGSIWLKQGQFSSGASPLDFHFANHKNAIASAILSAPRKGVLFASSHGEASTFSQRALSEWFYNQTEVEKGLCPRSLSRAHAHLSELGLGPSLGTSTRMGNSAEQQIRESLVQHQEASNALRQHSWLRDVGGVSLPGRKSQSGDLLAAYAEYEHNYGRSLKTLAEASALVSHHYVQTLQSNTKPRRQKDPNYQTAATPGEEHTIGSSPSAHQAKDSDEETEPRPPPTSVSSNEEVVLRQRLPDNRQSRQTSHPRCTSPSRSLESDLSSGTFILQKGSGDGCPSSRCLVQHSPDSTSSIPFFGSIKSRRSSYVLAITAERSKSFDEGLNSFRDEGRFFSKLPKRVKSFFADRSLESREEPQMKRHSTSELGTIIFSPFHKEGWLHYKQILKVNGKKIGSSIRPWKRAFAVLHHHSLVFYKDRREAVLLSAGAGHSLDDHPPPISIQGCLTDIAYSETKRKHTLRLTTQNLSEYLLQAEDGDEMLAWISVIRESSKADSEETRSSRQTLISKKLNDRKQSLTDNKPESSSGVHRMVPPVFMAPPTSLHLASRSDKAPWAMNLMKKGKKPEGPKVFGVRLEDCQPALNNKFVPFIVELCCGVVEERGLEYTGIYRVPGNNAVVSNLQENLNKGMDINTAEERWSDLNVISSLLKLFFRKLPEPLFTDDKYNKLIEANRIKNAEDRLKTIKKLIHGLPAHYFHTLRFLVAHLKRVADHSEKNKMEPRNLALVFGPTLVRTSEDNMAEMVTHMPDRYKIVETLILHKDWFFSDGMLSREEKALSKNDMELVPNIDHLLPNIGRMGMSGEGQRGRFNPR